MSRLIFGHPADNYAGQAVTVTPAEPVSGYPVSRLWDGKPSAAFKLGTTSGAIVFEFEYPTEIDIAAIIHHNLDQGLDVRIQGHTSDAWGAPSLDQAITIPPPGSETPPGSVGPFRDGPWVDLTSIGSRTFAFWRLVFASNLVPIMLGQVWLGAPKRQLLHNIAWGVSFGETRRAVVHTTDYDVETVYPRGTMIRTIRGSIETSDAGLAVIQAWRQACDFVAYPTLIIPDPTKNSAMLMRWTEQTVEDDAEFIDLHTVRATWREVSRGAAL
jgi:hypothetical protein